MLKDDAFRRYLTDQNAAQEGLTYLSQIGRTSLFSQTGTGK